MKLKIQNKILLTSTWLERFGEIMISVNEKFTEGIRILYYGAGWPTNIGNAFIDLGAISILREAVPQAHIAFASEMPRWFFGYSEKIAKISWSRKLFSRGKTLLPSMDNALDIASVSECDLAVFAGMAMCEEFVTVNGPSVLALARRGVPILLLGTGGSLYSDEEKELFGEFLRQLNPVGFISRDDLSYEIFKSYVPNAYKGIDCAFFIPEAYKPLALNLPPYTVVTFDSLPEPDLNIKQRLLIRAHHDCWGPLKNDYVCNDNTLVSDIPQDYLTLYCNAEEVHSDRVHACIATLAYGRRAQFYHPTLRGSLFEAVGAKDVRDELIQLDMQLLKEKKCVQVQCVKELITTLV
jgi:hypothetical protein